MARAPRWRPRLRNGEFFETGRLEASPALAVPIPERVHASTIQAAATHTLPTADLAKAFLRLDERQGNESKSIAELDVARAGIETGFRRLLWP